ncbi:sigma-54-dependent Fis family transcriptional regulator [Desulfoscipio geothermicus]|uniref:PAS domain S-box-containing protein n=1 Tax=Desulfoscipio geothermicus DSM 3669 TaxID=1121426 RepID=A0A1I6DJY8_9FIRM|nr:sigma 54-interacting transcriptional regulator [Desulfoscipio geothermicus]SFR05701.1 PAS domain S-box-containing protein [Desulfoscipio geothermicus DSM 3669]
MLSLMQAKEMEQRVSEAIAAALKVEVEIIDENLVRVAGTGKVRAGVGNRLLRGLVNKHVLQTGEPVFINEPGYHSICLSCPLSGTCFYYAYLVYPIQVDKKVIGTISLVAFDETQKQTLTGNTDTLLDFVGRMADLIAGKVVEREMVREKIVMANRLEAVVDAAYEGVLAIDEHGVITHCNRSAARMLGISKEQLIGQPVREIFTEMPLTEVLRKGKGFNSREFFMNLHGRKLHFLITARPIRSESGIAGVVTTFKDFREAQKMAYQIITSQEMLNFDDIIGESKAIREVKSQAAKIARSNSTVLIVGESGTGKEIFARAIHAASPHGHKPFVPINCGAIPEHLLESEFFGYEEGAFTGARRGGKPGKFELANGGTIFLDEIGNMSLYLQAKLLRVLQERQIERVGGTQVIPVDIRVIAATNNDLQDMVRRGRFREDLYYRLSVIPLVVPPLRERREDIPLLLEYYMRRFAKLLGKNITGFSARALKICLEYPWPGNIRELINAVEYAINLEEGAQILPESLPPRLRNREQRLVVNSVEIKPLEQLEKEAISRALEHYGWTDEGKMRAAAALGISRATIYRKINKYRLSEKKD